MDMQALLQQMQRGGGGAGGPPPGDYEMADTGERTYISSLAMLKMLKHCKAGIPFEVMGLMIGEVVDDYTITVEDCFSMPQAATTISVESIDETYQQKFTEMLKQVGQNKHVVGWYHSHPNFRPFLSGTDIQTTKQFEQLQPRCVGVVVDPINSTKASIDMDAFRSIPEQLIMGKKESRITTNNLGFLRKPNYTAINHGLNKFYYSIPVAFKKSEYEQNMLHCLYRCSWTNSLKLDPYTDQHTKNVESLKKMAKLTEQYNKWIIEENKKTTEEFKVESVGKMNPFTHLVKETEESLNTNVMNSLGTMLNTVVF